MSSTRLDGVIRPISKSEPPLATDGDIVRIGEAVLAGTHPYLNWTHLAHCATTIYLLRERPDMNLEAEMPKIIRRYNDAIGVANTPDSGYHHTLTLFYIGVIRKFLDDNCMGLGLASAVDALRRSPIGKREFVLNYYSRDHLFNPATREQWVAPDLKPLPYGSGLR